MDDLHPRRAGLDVHTYSVVAAVRLARNGPARTVVRSSGTTPPESLKLSTRLGEAGCAHVVMDAERRHWKPVWHVLPNGAVTLTLADAMHARSVPAR